MAQRPNSQTPADFEAHRKAAAEETARRAAVERNPTDAFLALEARVAALEGKSKKKAEETKPEPKPEPAK